MYCGRVLFHFFLSQGDMYAECHQNVITCYWFKNHEKLIDGFLPGLWTVSFLFFVSLLISPHCDCCTSSLKCANIHNVSIREHSLLFKRQTTVGGHQNNSEKNNSVFQPAATPMNKYTDTSLNIPKGSYHIQLSNWHRSIVQVLCSHFDTLTSVVCLNELQLYKNEFPYYTEKLFLTVANTHSCSIYGSLVLSLSFSKPRFDLTRRKSSRHNLTSR